MAQMVPKQAKRAHLEVPAKYVSTKISLCRTLLASILTGGMFR